MPIRARLEDGMKGFIAATIVSLTPALVLAAQPIDPAHCRLLPVHHPAPDVTYKPGVDVHGKPVVPADLSKGQRPPVRFEIPLTLALARQLNLAAPVTGLPETAEVGRIVVEGGKVLFNGQPIGRQAEDELAVLCNGTR